MFVCFFVRAQATSLTIALRMLMYLAAGGYQIVIYCYNGQRFTTAVGPASFVLGFLLMSQLLCFSVLFFIAERAHSDGIVRVYLVRGILGISSAHQNDDNARESELQPGRILVHQNVAAHPNVGELPSVTPSSTSSLTCLIIADDTRQRAVHGALAEPNAEEIKRRLRNSFRPGCARAAVYPYIDTLSTVNQYMYAVARGHLFSWAVRINAVRLIIHLAH